jgi:ABC-2 type transport system ATP-binding protein
VNSHLLSELEMICDRVAILVAGRVVQQGTIDELTLARQCFIIEVADAGLYAAALEGRLKATFTAQPAASGGNGSPPSPCARATLAGGAVCEVSGNTLRVMTTDVSVIQPVIDTLRATGFSIRRIQPARPSLEDLFIEAVGGIAGAHEAGALIGRPGFPVGGARP